MRIINSNYENKSPLLNYSGRLDLYMYKFLYIGQLKLWQTLIKRCIEIRDAKRAKHDIILETFPEHDIVPEEGVRM